MFQAFAQPVPNAGVDKAVLTIGTTNANSGDTTKNSQQWLNGTLSTGGGFPITTVLWTKISGPAGAIDTIYKGDQLNAVAARFNKSGTYQYKLTITNSNAQTASDTVVFTASKTPALIQPTGGLIIKQISCCEYSTNYLTSDNNIFQVVFNGSIKKLGMYGMTGDPVQVSGGQYWGSMVDNNGWGHILPHSVYYNELVWIPRDSTGALFDSLTYCQSYISSDFFLRNGNLYVYGTDRMGWYGPLGTAISKPLAVPMPSGGRYYTKITVSEGGVVGLANDGTVWQHRVNNKTPVQITGLPARPAIDICSERKGAHIAIVPDAGQPTTSGHPYGWGLTQFIGGSSGTTTVAADYRAIWNIHDVSNNVIPIKALAATDNSMHPIDTLGHLWGIGLNGGGEVGDGTELCNHAELWATPYAWNWSAGSFVTPAVDITPPATTFKKVFGGNAFGFGYAAIDALDTLWVGGRDKSFELGTMRTMSDGGNARPNMLDILAPFKLTPSPLYRTVVTVPVTLYTCNAGANQSITTSSTTVTATYTQTASYSFASGLWTKLTGTGGTITSPTSSSTTITGLSTGTYTYQFKMTDNNTATITDTVQIIVNTSTPPTVTITPSMQTIRLPVNSVSLNGGAVTSGGATVVSWTWSRRSGPVTFSFGTPNAQNTTVTFTGPGTYAFNLDVLDSNGNTGTQQATVIVLDYSRITLPAGCRFMAQ